MLKLQARQEFLLIVNESLSFKKEMLHKSFKNKS